MSAVAQILVMQTRAVLLVFKDRACEEFCSATFQFCGKSGSDSICNHFASNPSGKFCGVAQPRNSSRVSFDCQTSLVSKLFHLSEFLLTPLMCPALNSLAVLKRSAASVATVAQEPPEMVAPGSAKCRFFCDKIFLSEVFDDYSVLICQTCLYRFTGSAVWIKLGDDSH